MNRILFASALTVVLGAAPMVAFAGPKDGDGAAPAARGFAGRGHAGRGRFERARKGLRFLKSLELTDAQKALLADGRAQAEGVRKDLREKIAALLKTPVTGENAEQLRKDRRAKIRELVEAARGQVEPSAAKFVAALTPEQKAKIAEAATKHGKTYDEAKFTKRISMLMLAPGRHGHGHRHGGRR